MMRTQLDAIHDRGEPLAILWASEGSIYQRFGYGMSTHGGTSEGGARALRLRTAACAGWRGPTRRRGRGKAAVPADPRRGPSRTTRLLRSDARVLGHEYSPRSRALAPRGESRVPRRARGGWRGRWIRALPHQPRVGRRRSELVAHRQRADGNQPGRARSTCGGSCSTSTSSARSKRGTSRPTIRCSSPSSSRAGWNWDSATASGCGWWTWGRRWPAGGTRPTDASSSRCGSVLLVERGPLVAPCRGRRADRGAHGRRARSGGRDQ